MHMSDTLQSSTEDQALLRRVALWSVTYVEQALPIFEKKYPNELRPRQAVEAAREFGYGKKRDSKLRLLSMAAFKLGKTTEGSSKYVTRAACAAAAIAYTHTDLTTGIQGVRQARHVLGPVVYSAIALGDKGETLIDDAVAAAPSEVCLIIEQMPPQPAGEHQEDMLFARLDTGLRSKKRST